MPDVVSGVIIPAGGQDYMWVAEGSDPIPHPQTEQSTDLGTMQTTVHFVNEQREKRFLYKSHFVAFCASLLHHL